MAEKNPQNNDIALPPRLLLVAPPSKLLGDIVTVHLHSCGLGIIIVGVYIVMVCPWTDHILARNLLLEVEADLS